MNHGPAYQIKTERLLLRGWMPEDAPRLRAMLDNSNTHLRPWIPWMRDEPRSLDDTAAKLREHRANFDRDIHYRYAIFSPDGESLLGEVSLFNRVGPGGQELGYMLDKDASGKGYALEATAAAVRTAFVINGVERVEIHCAPENTASMSIAAKLGFQHDATLRRRSEDSEGRQRDSAVWTLFADEYAGTAAAAINIRAFDCLGRPLECTSV
jgi:RimJ/RimL family protein N-acetyltransferase